MSDRGVNESHRDDHYKLWEHQKESCKKLFDTLLSRFMKLLCNTEITNTQTAPFVTRTAVGNYNLLRLIYYLVFYVTPNTREVVCYVFTSANVKNGFMTSTLVVWNVMSREN